MGDFPPLRFISSGKNVIFRSRTQADFLDITHEYQLSYRTYISHQEFFSTHIITLLFLVFFHPVAPQIIVFSWRIRAYYFQRVIRPSLALLRCPVVGCSAPSLSFMPYTSAPPSVLLLQQGDARRSHPLGDIPRCIVRILHINFPATACPPAAALNRLH